MATILLLRVLFALIEFIIRQFELQQVKVRELRPRIGLDHHLVFSKAIRMVSHIDS